MTAEQVAAYAQFCESYESVRRAEGWGGDDLELPFEPRANTEIWTIRKRTFRRLDGLLRKEMPGGGTALDVGAGNCWLTRHLDHWGYDATALDVNDGPQDGLAAGSSYLEVGDKFERLRAPMESLPFLDGTFDLIVANASLHYTPNLGSTLGGFARAIRRDGIIVVMDSPWYERKKDGEREWERNVSALRERHGLDEGLARRSSFLYRSAFDVATLENGLEYQKISVWPGPRRAYEAIHARFYERRIASFPLLKIWSKGQGSAHGDS